MRLSSLPLLCLPALALAAGERHFDVEASFVAPAKPGANGAVEVTFRALDPDVRINEQPAPHLKLDLAQSVLIDKQPPSSTHVPDYDPLTARYLDLDKPVRFPVALSPLAPSGEQTVKAAVIFFYCSQREGWCRRGAADVEIALSVP